MTQNLLLGTTQDMDDVIRVMEKIYHFRHELPEADKREEGLTSPFGSAACL